MRLNVPRPKYQRALKIIRSTTLYTLVKSDSLKSFIMFILSLKLYSYPHGRFIFF
jgi:hypothetical protein